MARKHQLRDQRGGTIINATSKQQEKEIMGALARVAEALSREFGVRARLNHIKQWHLKDIVRELRILYPDLSFHHHFDTSYIRPDGGFLLLKSNQDALRRLYPILISEVKNQGTNDLRAREGKPKQARGNAIERLGKNVIGLRAALLRESIFPFVCFGYGDDFQPSSSILDRVSTIAMFGELNSIHLHNEADGRINRGSFFFREARWTVEEMAKIMHDIARRSILYYFSKYGENHFR